MIFVIEDNEVMRGCVVRAAQKAWRELMAEVECDKPGEDGERAQAARDTAGGRAELVVREFGDVLAAVQALDTEELPELIFLDILLTGWDGFSFLNEIASYADTAKIPVVVVSSLDFSGQDLSAYGVVGVLNKEKMTPEEIGEYVRRYCRAGDNEGAEEARYVTVGVGEGA